MAASLTETVKFSEGRRHLTVTSGLHSSLAHSEAPPQASRHTKTQRKLLILLNSLSGPDDARGTA